MSYKNLRCAVTGAFGFSGKYITRRLLDQGAQVVTLTNAPPEANPFGDKVRVFPLDFQRETLLHALEGVDVLFCTYWVRFDYEPYFSFARAVRNLETLFECAREAGVGRIVHISITNPSEDSPLPYFRGKALVEKALKATGISYAILRPALLFGKEDILINNIAWLLRRFRVFSIFGDGSYRLQPIYVDDLARIAVEQGLNQANVILNTIGPETFTFRGLVETLASILGLRRWIVSVPPRVGYWFAQIIGWFVDDIVLTWDEVQGLMAELLYVDDKPLGTTALTQWARDHRETLGVRYASELARRVRRPGR